MTEEKKGSISGTVKSISNETAEQLKSKKNKEKKESK